MTSPGGDRDLRTATWLGGDELPTKSRILTLTLGRWYSVKLKRDDASILSIR